MKAIVISEHGGFSVLKSDQAERPKIEADEVLVRVSCVALNHLDLWVRKGVPGHRFPLPIIPGCDISGVIEEVGELVKNVRPGDRVAVAPGYADTTSELALQGQDHLTRDYGIFGETRDGGCAEFVNLPARNVMKMPEHMDYPEAAAFPLTFLTAWGMMVRKAQIAQSEEVLIHAAGSGVSVACIQIAKLFNARRIFATAGSKEKLDKAAALGVDIGINYREDDFLAVVKEATGKAGVDIVVDHVGPDTFAKSLSALKKGGRLVTCGSTSGGTTEVNLRQVFFKSLSILGSTMAPRGDLVELWKLHCEGKLKPVVDKVFPARDIGKAHEYLESRKAFGKVVVDMREW